MITINNTQELISWKEIAAYLGVSTSTARRWRRDNGLPVYKVVGQRRANKEKLNAWMDRFKRKKRE